MVAGSLEGQTASRWMRRACVPRTTAGQRSGFLFFGGFHRRRIVGRGLAFLERNRARRAGGQTIAQSVAIIFTRESRLPIHHFNRAFMARLRAQAATGTLFFIDFDNFANHTSISPLRRGTLDFVLLLCYNGNQKSVGNPTKRGDTRGKFGDHRRVQTILRCGARGGRGPAGLRERALALLRAGRSDSPGRQPGARHRRSMRWGSLCGAGGNHRRAFAACPARRGGTVCGGVCVRGDDAPTRERDCRARLPGIAGRRAVVAGGAGTGRGHARACGKI